MNEGDILPELYVFKWWILEIMKEVLLDSDGAKVYHDCNKSSIFHRGELHSIFYRSATKAYLSTENFKLVNQKFLEAEK